MKQVVYTPQAPAPIGPYSQAISAGNMLFISGQIAIDPQTGEVVSGDVQQEARQVMENLSQILKAAGLGFQNVVKTTIFLRTMDDFGAVNQIYGGYFTDAPPARETVAVVGLPKNVRVEISCIAIR